MSKKIILGSILIALISYYVGTDSVYDAETKINRIISFGLYVMFQSPAVSSWVDPISIDKLINFPMITLNGFTIRGLSNITSGDDSRMTFDGDRLGIFLDIQSGHLEGSISYKMGFGFFSTQGTLKVMLDSMAIDAVFFLPTNYTGQPVLKDLKFKKLENFRTDGTFAMINSIVGSSFFKNNILGFLSNMLVTQVNNLILPHVILPWQDAHLKAFLKKGVTDTGGFVIAK